LDDEKIDSFDDLFEPFDLDEPPPPGEQAEAPPENPVDDTPGVTCPSCGSPNPAHNRHCEYCGARISQGPLPVAPQPMLRTTAGARALMVLAGVILAVALIALLVNLFSGSDGETAADTATDDTATSESIPLPAIEELVVADVVASSELPGFPASALVDTDPLNSWNDTQEGGQPTLTFNFATPVQITQITVQNVTDEERFHRNYRIEAYEIEIDDLPTVTSGTLSDTNESQTITVPSVQTTQLTLKVITTYPAESWDGKIPFRELALQEVKFFGREADAATGEEPGTETTG